jgi:hypothetical protein
MVSLWSRRSVRWPLAFVCSTLVSAFLTFDSLCTFSSPCEDDWTSVWLAALAITSLVAAFGWAGVVLLPLTTVMFGTLYEEYVWTRPPGLPEGMDYIAYYPSSVAFLLVFAVPFAIVVALTRTALLKHAMHGSAPDGMAPAGKARPDCPASASPPIGATHCRHRRWGTRRW